MRSAECQAELVSSGTKRYLPSRVCTTGGRQILTNDQCSIETRSLLRQGRSGITSRRETEAIRATREVQTSGYPSTCSSKSNCGDNHTGCTPLTASCRAESTLSVLQQTVWLKHGHREVKRVLSKCLVCRYQRVGPSSHNLAPLPSERVSFSPPFTHVGIDFASPLYVRGIPVHRKLMFASSPSHVIAWHA